MATKEGTSNRVGGRARERWEGLRDGFSLGARLFRDHDLGTYSVTIAHETLVASVALVLLGFGILGASGRRDVWSDQMAPHVEGRVLPGVFKGLDETVDRIFAHSSIGLIVFATLLAIWEASRAVRATMAALNRVYETEETRPWWRRSLLSAALAIPLIVALL